MRRQSAVQYTIRGVPLQVDQALRERSRREGKSVNQLAVEALRRFVELPPELPGNEELLELAGSWVEDPEIDAVLEEQRRVDEELWR